MWFFKPLLITRNAEKPPLGQSCPDVWCMARRWCYCCRSAVWWKHKWILQGNGGRRPNLQPTEWSQLQPSWEKPLRLGGRAVFHVLNVAVLISAAESGEWFGCHLLGLCFWNMRSIHLFLSLSFSSQPQFFSEAASCADVRHDSSTSLVELTNSCGLLNLYVYLLTIKKETLCVWRINWLTSARGHLMAILTAISFNNHYCFHSVLLKSLKHLIFIFLLA